MFLGGFVVLFLGLAFFFFVLPQGLCASPAIMPTTACVALASQVKIITKIPSKKSRASALLRTLAPAPSLFSTRKIAASSLGLSGYVGIGTTSPAAALHVYGGDALINTMTVGLGNGNHATYTAVGYHALAATPTQTWYANNTAIGYTALTANSSSSANTAVGAYALSSDVSGPNNTAVGASALQNDTANANTAVGAGALYTNISGFYNTAEGVSALYNSTGNYNTAIGFQAGYDVSSGSDNIIIGDYSTTGVGVTTGNNNILLGFDVRPPSQTASNQLNIGNLIYATGLASGATASTGNVGMGFTSPFSASPIAAIADATEAAFQNLSWQEKRHRNRGRGRTLTAAARDYDDHSRASPRRKAA